jgi:hypothetical protein
MQNTDLGPHVQMNAAQRTDEAQWFEDSRDAMRVASRYSELRTLGRYHEAMQLFHADAVLVTLDAVVYGAAAIEVALLDLTQLMHLQRFFRKWRLAPNSLDDMDELLVTGADAADGASHGLKKAKAKATRFVLEREGRMYRSHQYLDWRYFTVRESIVVADGKIRMIETSAKM